MYLPAPSFWFLHWISLQQRLISEGQRFVTVSQVGQCRWYGGLAFSLWIGASQQLVIPRSFSLYDLWWAYSNGSVTHCAPVRVTHLMFAQEPVRVNNNPAGLEWPDCWSKHQITYFSSHNEQLTVYLWFSCPYLLSPNVIHGHSYKHSVSCHAWLS